MQGSQREEQDNFIIHPEQDWQCRWWSKEFGVHPAELRSAIQEVGPLARNVRKHLAKSKPLSAPRA